MQLSHYPVSYIVYKNAYCTVLLASYFLMNAWTQYNHSDNAAYYILKVDLF